MRKRVPKRISSKENSEIFKKKSPQKEMNLSAGTCRLPLVADNQAA